MITKRMAINLAERKISEYQKNCPTKIQINYEAIDEFPLGFVFYYNTKAYFKTRDLKDSLAGNCPILVEKGTGNIQILPTNQTAEKSVAELEKKLSRS